MINNSNLAIPKLEIKPEFQIFEIGTSIKMSGTTIDITTTRAENIVNNFKNNARGQRIPIDLDHKGGESLGWIKDIRIKGNKIIVEPEYTEKAINILQSGEYAYNSPELEFNWEDPITHISYQDVLTSVSLTNRPVQKNFTSVLVGFSEQQKGDVSMDEIVNEQNQEETLQSLYDGLKAACDKLQKHPELFRKIGASKVKQGFGLVLDSLNKFIKANDKEVLAMNENQLSLSEVEKYKSELEESFKVRCSEIESKMVDALKLAEEKEKIAEERVKLAEERVKMLEEKDCRREDEVFLSELIHEGKVLPKDREQTLKDLIAARRAGVIKFSENENYDYYSELKNRLSSKVKVIEFSEVGSSKNETKSSGVQVVELAEKIMSEKKIPRKEAIAQARKELGHEYEIKQK